jgi:hypothetical protein
MVPQTYCLSPSGITIQVETSFSSHRLLVLGPVETDRTWIGSLETQYTPWANWVHFLTLENNNKNPT